MNLLLDTHTLLWTLGDPEELSAEARAAIEAPANEVMVSAASVWEMSIKASLGKLDMPGDLLEQLATMRFTPLPVSQAHAWAVRDLPLHHRDPFDRLLVAQALVEGLVVVSRDPAFTAYLPDVLGC